MNWGTHNVSLAALQTVSTLPASITTVCESSFLVKHRPKPSTSNLFPFSPASSFVQLPTPLVKSRTRGMESNLAEDLKSHAFLHQRTTQPNRRQLRSQPHHQHLHQRRCPTRPPPRPLLPPRPCRRCNLPSPLRFDQRGHQRDLSASPAKFNNLLLKILASQHQDKLRLTLLLVKASTCSIHQLARVIWKPSSPSTMAPLIFNCGPSVTTLKPHTVSSVFPMIV